jgi:putative ABC transport system permease protein
MPWRLVFSHLRKAWFRTLLTAGGVALAMFLLATLRTVVTGLQSAVKDSNSRRLLSLSTMGFFKRQPPRLVHELRAQPGVRDVTQWTWFGGVYVDEKNMFSRFATDPPSFRRIYGEGPRPDILMPKEQWQAFETDRASCIVGAGLVRQFGFKLGDKIEMTGNIFPGHYTFTVRGVYEKGLEAMDEAMLFFHFKYLDEMSLKQTGRPADVGVWIMQCEEGADMGRIAHDIDARFASSDHATQTATEAAFNQMFISMWGNVPLLLSMIGGAVLFAAFMIALNTMLLNGRERRLEIGVLKALGFSTGVVATLLVVEGALVCWLGGVAGVVGANLMFNTGPVPALEKFFPGFHILPETSLACVGVSVAVGLVSGVVPAFVAAKTSVVDGLSRHA